MALCILAPLQAETLPLSKFAYQTWSTEAGLPQISVHGMVEDGEGLLWIATENGLARFDGSRFEVFDRSNTPRLASSWVTRLMRDHQDRIWIGTLRNLVRWEQGRFVDVPVQSLAPGRIEDLAEDSQGRVWLAGDNLFVEEKGAMLPVPGWEGRPSALLADRDGMWVGGAGGVLAYHRSGRWQRQQFPALGESQILALAKAGGQIWLGTSHGLFSLRDGQLSNVPLGKGPAPKVATLTVDKQGRVIAGCDAQIFIVEGGQVVDSFDAGPSGLAGIASLYVARDGSLWVGSQQQGLRHFFVSGARSLVASDGLRDLRTWSMVPIPQGIVVGHNAGYDLLSHGRFTPLFSADQFPEPSGYSSWYDRQGRMWLGTRGGLVRMLPDGTQRKQFTQFNGLQINGLFEDSQGAMWVASSQGLFRIMDDVITNAGEGHGLQEKKVRSVLFDNQGRLWVGTERGLYQRHGTTFQKIDDAVLGQVFVSTMLQLRDGRLAVGAYDDGLFIQDGEHWRQLDKRNGLPSMSVFFLAEHKGFLIASSSDGVYRIPVATLGRDGTGIKDLEILLLDQGDRLGKSRVRCCNGAGMGKGAIVNDTLLLPTLNGVAVLPLDAAHEPPPVVRKLSVSGPGLSASRGQLDAGMQMDPILLPDSVRDIDIGFSVIDFRRAGALSYRYRLVDFDNDWMMAGAGAKGHYTHLPPGRWKLEVQAHHLYEPWGPSTMVEIVVPANFTEGWAFRFLLILLITAMLVAWIRWREERLLRQKRELEALVAERTADLEKSNETLAALSVTDALTGLHNRRYLQDQIERLIASTIRARQDQRSDVVLGLALIDVDQFKAVNDNWGHGVGDQVLCRVADALRSVGRASDILVRWGGEEFLVVLTGTQRAELPMIAERLRIAIADSLPRPGEPGRVTASIGHIGFPLERAAATGQDWLHALAFADKALYGAKAAGRNCIAGLSFVGEDLSRLSGRQLLDHLPELIESGQIRLLHGFPPAP